VRAEMDERAAPPPRLGFCAGHESSSQPASTQRLVDPHRLELAAPTPGDARDAGNDAAVVLTGEDCELFVIAQARGGDCRYSDPLLEQREVGGLRRVLDDEAVGTVHEKPWRHAPMPPPASAPAARRCRSSSGMQRSRPR